MFGSDILEVAIGIIFIYLLVSIMCSVIRESIEAWLKTRAAYLEHGIRELLHDKKAEGIVKSFYNHPHINCLFLEEYLPRPLKRLGLLAKGGNLPSYIPAKNFALALMDIAARGPDTDEVSSDPNAPVISLANIRLNIANIRNPAVQRSLLTAVDSAQGDLNQAQANIEAWYDSSMDRVSGWYKRSTQWVIFWIGLTVAVGLNINTITIADYLYRNDSVRASIVARAQTAVADSALMTQSYQAVKTGLDSLALPIGWSGGWGSPKSESVSLDLTQWRKFDVWNYLLAPILGWLLTAFAATMGAPFWFDLLNKVMVIRSTVKPHEKSPEESSEDRQFPAQWSVNGTAASREIIPENENGNGKINKNLTFFSPPAPLEQIPNSTDAESGIDGCSGHEHAIADSELTSDVDLPIAQGGIA